MKRFLIFGITEFSDINAGARGYLGQFETFEELTDILNKNKEKILSEYIESFNILDLQYDKIIVNDEYDYWDLIDTNNSLDDFKFNNDGLCELMKKVKERISPNISLSKLKSKSEIEDEINKSLSSLTKEEFTDMLDTTIRLYKKYLNN